MDLKIDFWDVGQGDCSVVHLPDGELFIIDVGPPNSALVEWLESRPHLAIHTIVITHNDEDHAGCLEHILEKCHRRIRRVVMMVDRNYDDEKMVRILQCVLRHFDKGHIQLEKLEIATAPTPLFWTDNGEFVIKVMHPNFASSAKNLLRKQPSPNEVSGILCLDTAGKNQIIWPGDAAMQTIAKVCKFLKPLMIVGPHHGAPIKRNQASYSPSFDAIEPENVYISVGSHNGHNHPNKGFIGEHVERCRSVTCSQLVMCDRHRYKENLHVMNHHLLLGMIPPHSVNAVTCRGPIQLRWNDVEKKFEFDRFHSEHREKVESLHHPYCLGK